MKSLIYKTIPTGIIIEKTAMIPVSGDRSGDISKKKKKLSVITVVSKIAIAIKPIAYIRKNSCLSDKFVSVFI